MMLAQFLVCKYVLGLAMCFIFRRLYFLLESLLTTNYKLWPLRDFIVSLRSTTDGGRSRGCQIEACLTSLRTVYIRITT